MRRKPGRDLVRPRLRRGRFAEGAASGWITRGLSLALLGREALWALRALISASKAGSMNRSRATSILSVDTVVSRHGPCGRSLSTPNTGRG